jgi:membrane protease YdiL (CAAX protease family)
VDDLRFVRVRCVRQLRPIVLVCAVLALWLVLAPAALAADGVGTAGRVSDKTVTLAMFGVIAFFPVLVIVLAAIQGKLEARKERRRYDLERLG